MAAQSALYFFVKQHKARKSGILLLYNLHTQTHTVQKSQF